MQNYRVPGATSPRSYPGLSRPLPTSRTGPQSKNKLCAQYAAEGRKRPWLVDKKLEVAGCKNPGAARGFASVRIWGLAVFCRRGCRRVRPASRGLVGRLAPPPPIDRGTTEPLGGGGGGRGLGGNTATGGYIAFAWRDRMNARAGAEVWLAVLFLRQPDAARPPKRPEVATNNMLAVTIRIPKDSVANRFLLHPLRLPSPRSLLLS